MTGLGCIATRINLKPCLFFSLDSLRAALSTLFYSAEAINSDKAAYKDWRLPLVRGYKSRRVNGPYSTRNVNGCANIRRLPRLPDVQRVESPILSPGRRSFWGRGGRLLWWIAFKTQVTGAHSWSIQHKKPPSPGRFSFLPLNRRALPVAQHPVRKLELTDAEPL